MNDVVNQSEIDKLFNDVNFDCLGNKQKPKKYKFSDYQISNTADYLLEAINRKQLKSFLQALLKLMSIKISNGKEQYDATLELAKIFKVKL